MPDKYAIPDCEENHFLLKLHNMHNAGAAAPHRGRPMMYVRANVSNGIFNIRKKLEELEPMGFRIDWDDYDGKNAQQQAQQGAG